MTTTPTVGNAVTFSFDPLAFGPQVTALADDTFLLAWEDGTDIHARHLDELGSFTGGDILTQLSSDDAHALGSPHAFQTTNGNTVVIYGRQADAGDQDIFSHALNDDFSPGENSAPVENSPASETLVATAATAGGGGVVAYEVRNGNDFHTDLRFVDQTGHPVGNRVFLGPHAGESEQDAAVVGLANGNVAVAYQKFFAATGAREIRFEIVSPDGHNSGGVPISLQQFAGGFPDLGVLSDGSFMVVWQANDGIEMRHILQSGQIDTGVVKIRDTVGALLPKVTGLNDGTFLVAWTQASGTESDGSPNEDIFLQRFGFNANHDFVGIGSPIHLAQPGDQGLFQLKMTTLADGRVLITYSSETGDATNVTTLDYRIIDPRESSLTGTNRDDTIVAREDGSFIAGLGGNDKLIGRDSIDVLDGGEGNDILDGGLGDDQLVGGAGIDTASFKNVAAAVIVNLTVGTAIGQGNDVLSNDIENVVGSRLDDNITGNAGSNFIDGGGGADIMRGLGGDDTYIVDNAGDQVFEVAGGDFDTVFTSVSYALKAGQSIELLSGGGTGTTPINLTGNEFAQEIDGNAGSNIIDGKGGADSMFGFGGNDTYLVDNAGDRVFEQVGGGTDRVKTSVNYTLGAGQSIEQLTTTNTAGTTALRLTGNEFAQTIVGNAGDNVIDGKGGADTLSGLGGNDIYFVDNAGDRVVEAANGGTDRVLASVSYALRAGQSIETLSTTNNAGTEAIDLTGNELANAIFGNNGSNTLDGKGGADTMSGLGGDDVYVVDNAGDVVNEKAGGGHDEVFTSVSYALKAGQSIEQLEASGSAAINLTGNELAQDLGGNAGANVIDGKGGADTMFGRGGSDTYIVDNAGDLVFERANEGTDRVLTSVGYTLGDGQSIEQLATTDSAGIAALHLTGNDLAQTISGNAGNNVIDGRGGNDTLTGLGGHDTFVFDTTPDSATNVDRITDFSVADDIIALSHAIYQAVAPGALSADAFFIGGAAHDASDRVIYNAGTGALSFDADGNGAGAAVQFAKLSSGLTTLSAADFKIIA